MKTIVFIPFLFCALLAKAQFVVPFTGGNQDAAIQSALATYTLVELDGVHAYQFSNTNLSVRSGTTFNLRGSTLKYTGSATSGALIKTAYSTRVNTAATIAVTKGSKTFTTTSAIASAIHVGDIVQISGPAYANSGYYDYNYGWYSMVTAVSGTTVTLDYASTDTYSGYHITVYNPGTNIHILNGTLDVRGYLGSGIYGFQMNHATHSSIDGINIVGDSNTVNGLGVGVRVTGCYITIQNGVFSGLRPLIPDNAVAYMMDVQGDSVVVQNNSVFNAGTGLMSGGKDFINTRIWYKNNYVNSRQASKQAMDFHGNSQGGMTGNYVDKYYGPMGVSFRRRNTVFVNNTVIMHNTENVGQRALQVFETADENIVIQNNKFELHGPSGLGVNAAIANISPQFFAFKNVKISGNLIRGSSGIILKYAFGTGITISDNFFEQIDTYVPGINMQGSAYGSYTLSNNTFVHNTSGVAITTNATSVGGGTISGNKTYHTTCSISTTPYKIGNTTNTISGNILYASAGTPVSSVSGNSLSGNLLSACTTAPTTPNIPGTGVVVTPPPDTGIVVIPPPPPVVVDSSNWIEIRWKDTIPLSSSYTMPPVPPKPNVKWVNAAKGGILNLPDPSTLPATFTFKLFNDTKQPIQCNRYLYLVIGKNWKSSTWKGSFYPKCKITIQNGKYKMTAI